MQVEINGIPVSLFGDIETYEGGYLFWSGGVSSPKEIASCFRFWLTNQIPEDLPPGTIIRMQVIPAIKASE